MYYHPPGSSAHGFLQARIPEWVAMPSSRGSSWLRNWTHVFCISCIAGRFSTTEPPRKPHLELHPFLFIRDSIPRYVVHPVTNWWALVVSLDILTSTPEAVHVSAGPLGLTFWKMGEFLSSEEIHFTAGQAWLTEVFQERDFPGNKWMKGSFHLPDSKAPPWPQSQDLTLRGCERDGKKQYLMGLLLTLPVYCILLTNTPKNHSQIT